MMRMKNKPLDLEMWKRNPVRVFVAWWGQKPVWGDSEERREDLETVKIHDSSEVMTISKSREMEG